jgi:hypothetical protein
MKKKTAPLHRSLALVLAVKGGEPLLPATIKNARRTAGDDIEIICSYDGKESVPAGSVGEDTRVVSYCTGSGPTRHAGIMATNAKIIFTCDAHMDFSNGWAVAAVDYIRGHARTVVCAPMRACDSHFQRHAGKTRDIYTGCRMQWIDRGESETRCLCAKWSDNKPGDQIGVVMGAFYGFTRAWYVSMGAPWAALTGYGLDEEMISIASWLSGGDVRIIPDIEVAHVFRDVSPSLSSRDDYARIWANRLRLPHLVPVTPPERYALIEALTESSSFASYRFILDAVKADQERPSVAALKKIWTAHRREWEAFRMRFVDGFIPVELPAISIPSDPAAEKFTPPPEIPAGARRQVIHVPPTVCERCNALNSFSLPRSGRTVGATEISNKRQFVVCSHCGAKAVRIFDGTIRQGANALQQALRVG